MKFYISLYIGFMFFSLGCTPCRQVKIDSFPPGAAVSIDTSSSHQKHQTLPPPPIWSFLGHTPFNISACSLDSEIKADWENRELFYPEYHGAEQIYFDFEKEDIEEE